MKRHRRRTIKDGPAEIYTDALLRVRAAMNRGDFREARRCYFLARSTARSYVIVPAATGSPHSEQVTTGVK